MLINSLKNYHKNWRREKMRAISLFSGVSLNGGHRCSFHFFPLCVDTVVGTEHRWYVKLSVHLGCLLSNHRLWFTVVWVVAFILCGFSVRRHEVELMGTSLLAGLDHGTLSFWTWERGPWSFNPLWIHSSLFIRLPLSPSFILRKFW